MTEMFLSVVIPAYNEELSLRELFAQVSQYAAEFGREWEVLFVDDGSTDGSWKVMRALVEENPSRVRALRMRRNFGKATALAAGFREARGEIIFTMDADLQDDPKEMPRFIAKLDEGYDLVSGWKKIRHDPIDKTFPSLLFNAMVRFFSGVKLHDFNNGYKAYRREVVETLPLYGEMHRFIPVFANAEGFRVAEIPVEHHARKFGCSKYGFGRFVKGLLDLFSVTIMTRFGARPGHFFGGVGIIVGAIGFFTLLYLWINQFFGNYIDGRPLFFFGIMCVLLAAQMIGTGVLAELFLRQGGGVRRKIPVVEKKGFDE